MHDSSTSAGEATTSTDLRDGVLAANIPTLLAVLVQLTGDERWLKAPYLLSRPRGIDDNDSGGLSAEIQAEIREAAFAAIMNSHETHHDMTRLDKDELVRLLSAAMGEPIPAEYGPLIISGLSTPDPDDSPPKADWSGKSVIIIGGGISGLCAAVNLQRMGLPFVILERHSDLGGSWWESRYPGAGVDIPSHLYEFAFFPNDWQHYFATRDEIYEYLHAVADRFDIRRHIHLGTSVVSAQYDSDANSWVVETTRSGERRTFHAEIVISAVGAFNQPAVPGIPGLDRFTGPVFHTSDWQDVDLAGKRVAVLGNGASAMQVVPAIVEDVGQLIIVQRSPHWISPFAKLHQRIPDPVRHLMMEVPSYRAWYRLRLGWTFMDKLHSALRRDPEWAHPERSVNSANDGQRRYFTRYIKSELGYRQDLIDAVLPTYPPYGKRILLDNGWYAALKRDNVVLETSSKSEFTEDSLCVNDRQYPVDVVVLATGFRVVRFLSTYKVTGRDGTTLDDVWGDDDARAYLGLAVPFFPNFFILYGPNTAPGHGGSLMPTVEAQMDYLAALLKSANDRGFDRIEVDPEAYETYNAAVDAEHEQMIWTHPGMDTYYRNGAGRVVVNNPFRIIDFWSRTRKIKWQDWRIDGHPVQPDAQSAQM